MITDGSTFSLLSRVKFFLEIDRYIGLPIFFPIFKHFTIIGLNIYIYIFFIYYYLSHTQLYRV